MDSELTKEDIGVLLEAMEAWENRRLSGEILLGITETFGIKYSNDDPVQREEAMKKQQEKMIKRSEENQALAKKDKERSVILRTKLLLLRDKMDVDSLTKG